MEAAVDDILLKTINEEMENARKLQEEKREEIRGREEEKGEEDAMKKTTRALGKVAQKHSTREAVKQGVIVGYNIRKSIKEGHFDGSTFYTVLFLSIVKDTVDLVTLGTFGVVVNIFVTLALFIIFFLKKSRLKRFLIKRFIWPVIAEFIPFISAFPFYTVSTILLKIKADKISKDLEEQAKQVDKEIEELKKQEAKLNYA